MKAILIDPFDESVSEVDYNGDYKEISNLINCGPIDYVRLDDTNDIYVDDEGLLYDDTDEDRNFGFAFGICDPVFGKGLIMGLDYKNGETTDRPYIPMEKYVDSICYGWSAKKPEPKIEVRSFDNFEDLIKG